MNFERKVIETLKDDNGNEIENGDVVIYKTGNKPQSIIAKFQGFDKGYMLFVPIGVDEPYSVQPKTINYFFKVNATHLFTLG